MEFCVIIWKQYTQNKPLKMLSFNCWNNWWLMTEISNISWLTEEKILINLSENTRKVVTGQGDDYTIIITSKIFISCLN